MVRSRILRWTLCSLSVVLFSSAPAFAQRGGGMRLQQRARVELATLPEVQSELKLTDEQKTLATEETAKLREKRAALMQGGGGGGGQAARAELTKMTADMDAAFHAKLDEAQQKRMNGLLIQVNGPAAALDPAISKALGLSDEAVAKLKAAVDANTAARREAMQDAQNASQDERAEMMRKLSEKESAALLAAMSDGDKKKLEEMKGAALTIDQAPLRQRRN